MNWNEVTSAIEARSPRGAKGKNKNDVFCFLLSAIYKVSGL